MEKIAEQISITPINSAVLKAKVSVLISGVKINNISIFKKDYGLEVAFAKSGYMKKSDGKYYEDRLPPVQLDSHSAQETLEGEIIAAYKQEMEASAPAASKAVTDAPQHSVA